MKKKWYRIENKTNSADIYIYDEIGMWGVDAKDFATSLALIKDFDQINVFINSPGGDVFEGMAIYNALLTVKDKLTAHVMGMAASIASIILMAAPKRIIHQGALVMIHNPSSGIWGTASDLRKRAETLDKITDQMVDIYRGVTGLEDSEIRKLLDDETWMEAEEAVENGFATDLNEEEAAASLQKKYVSKFHNLPSEVVIVEEPTIREAEDALRDAGFSQAVAKKILSQGFNRDDCDPRRDGDEDFSEAIQMLDKMIEKVGGTQRG